jgi:capsid assembly protease
MTDRYARIIAEVRDQPWAILPSKLAAITSLLQLRAAGVTLTERDLQARLGEPRERPDLDVTSGGVGILPVFGVLAQRMNLMQAISGGTSTEQLADEFRALRDDPKVKAILLAVDSPGGSIYGIEELADEIREARDRGGKPIVAIADSLAASAAYWLAAQADTVYTTPGGDVGSIGVFTAHEDLSGALEQAGIKTTLIAAGPYKTEANPFEPLSDEARAAIQARVDGAYGRFLAGVAAGRRVPAATVRSSYGGGRVLAARDALAAGMVDGLATLGAVIENLEATVPRSRSTTLSGGAAPRQPSATAQEPSPATAQERHADKLWQQRVECDLLEL